MIRSKRLTLRRNELTKVEKEQKRDFAFIRAGGQCQLDSWLHCCGGRYWPMTGGLRQRGHLVHLRNKRMWGWGDQNIAWGCPHGHSDLMHTKGLQVPRTYSELVQIPRKDGGASQGDSDAGRRTL